LQAATLNGSKKLGAKSLSAVAYVVLLVPTLYIALGQLLEKQWLYLPYYVTQWMTTYTAGFVRRGFLGSVVWRLSTAMDTNPLFVIDIGRFIVAVSFAFLMGKLVLKNRYALGIVGAITLLTNPYICFYEWCQPGSLDLFFVFVTACHLSLTKLDRDRYLRGAILFFGIFGTMLALTHEAFLLVCLPINLIVGWQTLTKKPIQAENGESAALDSSLRVPLLRTVAIFLLPTLACVIAMRFHGTPAQAKAIWAQWDAIKVSQPIHIGFEELGWTLPQEISNIWSDFHASHLPLWILDVAVCMAPLALLAWKHPKANGVNFRKDLIYYFLLPLAASAPMYLLGSDWDRWLSLSCVTYVVVLLWKPTLSESWKPNRALTVGLISLSVAGLFVRPYTPFVPENRALAGPVVRATEYFTGQMPR
jgi:hypothetical protein